LQTIIALLLVNYGLQSQIKTVNLSQEARFLGNTLAMLLGYAAPKPSLTYQLLELAKFVVCPYQEIELIVPHFAD